ncbi:hypothetical protein [Accumulibacter sp.]|uniref:hypothetical protein n=1 Tax=Accumulibacter sp. TaxID=2053492 RepID=UPI0028C4952A|nr:hypothetical protein [Accumulibacter sp.]
MTEMLQRSIDCEGVPGFAPPQVARVKVLALLTQCAELAVVDGLRSSSVTYYWFCTQVVTTGV